MEHGRSRSKKTLDKVGGGPYATASMSSPLSPEMLTKGADHVQPWTERGDLKNAGQEEGCQEGRKQEEEVSAPGIRGGGPITLPSLSQFLRGGISSMATKKATKKAAPKKKATKKK